MDKYTVPHLSYLLTIYSFVVCDMCLTVFTSIFTRVAKAFPHNISDITLNMPM